MAPPRLTPDNEKLVKELIATFLHARSGSYPSSHSDMTVGFTAVLRMYEVTRRLAPYDPLAYHTNDPDLDEQT